MPVIEMWRDTYFSDSSSDEAAEIIITDVQPSSGGILPYRYEPVRRTGGGDDRSEENAATGSEGPAGAEQEEEDNPFTHGINFEAQLDMDVSEWCTCDNCASMDNPVMNLCCHELEAIQGKIFKDDLDCITLHSDFEMVVLAQPILRTALVAMKDVKKASLVEPISERTYRLAAYRQFTWWAHDRLGKKVRKVIPSCVVQIIRERYPDPNGEYTGYREADETDTVYPD